MPRAAAIAPVAVIVGFAAMALVGTPPSSRVRPSIEKYFDRQTGVLCFVPVEDDTPGGIWCTPTAGAVPAPPERAEEGP